MSDRDKIVLQKIVKYANEAIKYCVAYNEMEAFAEDSMCVEACVFDLLQIGELAKIKLSKDVKNNAVDIPWNQLYGMRNRIVHDYDGVDLSVVWNIIKRDLPQLVGKLEHTMEGNDNG